MAKTTLTKRIEGVGNPTVQELKDLLEGVPLDGKVSVQKIPRDRPFDPEGWSISISYQPEDPPKLSLPGHKPGYRSGGPKPRGLTSEDFDNAGRPIDDPGNELTRTEPLVGTPESKMGLIQEPRGYDQATEHPGEGFRDVARIVKDNPQA